MKAHRVKKLKSERKRLERKGRHDKVKKIDLVLNLSNPKPGPVATATKK